MFLSIFNYSTKWNIGDLSVDVSIGLDNYKHAKCPTGPKHQLF